MVNHSQRVCVRAPHLSIPHREMKREKDAGIKLNREAANWVVHG